MAGISHVLNLAKEALLTHQSSIAVTGHNVANVNTVGYSRQTLSLNTPAASPSGVGMIGNGVRGNSVGRSYDRFMVQRLVDQESTLANLEAQDQSMRFVETAFNEAPGMAMNDLLSQFWSSWQDVATNPELISTRQSVVQQAALINEQFNMMTAEIAASRQDISSNLQASVQNVNAITEQLASINVQIASSESDVQQQNDLRDERDRLTKELSQYMDINYFEMDSGAVTILLTDGHSLVENDTSWNLTWADNSIAWQSTNSQDTTVATKIGTHYPLGGRIGGWLEVHDQLIEGQPENYLGRLDALANSLIREVNEAHSQGVGLISHADKLTSVNQANLTTLLQSTVDIATANEDIPAGAITINGREVGLIAGVIPIDSNTVPPRNSYDLAMGKTYNAATAINNSLSDVQAKLTTQVQGTAVTVPAELDTFQFFIEGVEINYEASNLDEADLSGTTFANNLRDTIETAITNHNDPLAVPENIPKVEITALVGTGLNGGAPNSIVLRNTNEGDDSNIEITGIEDDPDVIPLTPYTMEQKLGLANGTVVADATHNTGQLSLFNHNGQIEIDAGSNDTYLTQLGLGGGNATTGGVDDFAGDGQINFSSSDNGVQHSINGYDYSSTLNLDGGSFDIWIYNSDDTLALPQPVSIPTDRAYTLEDIANAINISIMNASGESTSWVQARVEDERLTLTPDADHKFAFGGDSSNFLATAGLNTFFSGHSAATIQVNTFVADNLEHVAAGKVNDHGEIFRGSELNALDLTNIQRMEDIAFKGSSANTLDGHYNSLVAEIGLKGQSVERDLEYNTIVTGQLQQMNDSVSGVNLDEEMANLIKFQHAYSAAAKLITISDEMLQTLLATVAR
jgi:flagellar hook-associated protein FlgK